MPNFKGSNEITIQPGDSSVTYGFYISTCSSVSANDGYIPYGTSVSGVSVTATDDTADRTTVSGLVDSSSVLNNVVNVVMSYPSAGAGRYRLKFLLTLDTGAIIEADFGRVNVVNL